MPDGADKPGPQPGMQSGSQLIERKLATILSADVAEFSRLMNEDEEQTLRTFRGHKKIFESLVITHHGRVFNTAGDAILAEFASAVEAVRCATDVQSALRTRNDQLPASRQVRFRIGMNLGDVMIQGQDLLGDGVNVAARLQTAAEPGGICISGSVHDQIRNKLSLAFHSLGERTYKNIPQPVRTFSIVEAEGGAPLPSPKPPSAWKNPALWAVAAIAIVAAAGSAAYVILHQRSRNQLAAERAANMRSAPSAPASTIAPPPASASTASAAAKTVDAAKPAKTDLAGEPKPVAKPHLATPTAAARFGRFDGVYSGPVCYGKTRELPEHCYRAEATIRGNTITGTWPMPNEFGVTMFLEGEVTPAGNVTVLMHSERADSTHLATINLGGTVRAGVLEADGKFLRGRSASINWHLAPSSAR
jgi:class 3 adenylate cyclase